MNGDGYSDILVGVPGYSNGQSNEGRLFLSRLCKRYQSRCQYGAGKQLGR
ncbi:MAG: FG-GAP repeat protein [Chitinophagaceae bacterium]|nr:FG-GAP repeat protein [Chitinophagaceae bacterium]